MTTTLPDELIGQIFLKLPVKSLVRFKIVNKSVHSSISDPRFAISHFEHAAARTQRLVCMEPGIREFSSMDFNLSLFASSVLNLDFMQHFDYLRIIGSCRGLILLNFKKVLCIWNPSTGFYRFIGWSLFVSSNIMKSHGFYISVSGFGYDSANDDYLVILVFEDVMHALTHIEYFSFRSNAWIPIETTPFKDSFASCEDGSFLNGAIHWLAYSLRTSNTVIVAFDLTERRCSEISQPIDFDFSEYEHGVLAVVGDMLHLCDLRNKYVTEIWVMKEYKLQSSWSKTFVVSLNHVPFQVRGFIPLCYTSSGDIVGIYGKALLVKYNKEGQMLEHLFKHNIKSEWVVYTESLLSLPW